MSKEKFTPGPWINKSEKGHYFSGGAAVNNADSTRTIALIYGEGKIEIDANARLIADAPEFYKQLKDVLDKWDNDNISDADWKGIRDLINRHQ